jgi:polyferredoxin
MMQDKNTLLVVYRDGKENEKVCIECKKCVRVCHMDIDIRDSPFQIECVHCGECIDACEDVLRRIGKPGLIHYSWGEMGADPARREPWYQRLGFRDSKRVLILAVLLFYLTGLGIALSTRRPVLVRLAPDRAVLYSKLEDGRIVNRIRLSLANRSGQPVSVRLWVENLPGAEIGLAQNPVPLKPGEAFEKTFELRVAGWAGSSDVNRFRFMAQSSAGGDAEAFEMTFILPVPGKEGK